MSFVPRGYEQIVRDLLTLLTGGTVGESLAVPAGNAPIKPLKLKDRPVRRVSHLEGTITAGTGAEARDVSYRFTPADFELVSSSGGGELDAIAFRKGGRRPKPGSELTVNYYPVTARPVPLSDLNVGSVTRTLLETVAAELALANLSLKRVYDAAFLDTAEATSLDGVVALVGVRRLAGGHPVVKVRFTRRPESPGRITVAAGTALTDKAGSRYLTATAFTMEPNESTREVLAIGEAPTTKLVKEGELDRLEVLVAGISTVTNVEPARQLTAPETDDELRRRARGALHGTVRGTLGALRFSLLSIPGVQDAKIVEAPNGTPGEIRVDVAYTSPDAAVRAEVERVIAEVRPAGIRVIGPREAARTRLTVTVELTLAGAGAQGAELDALEQGVEARLAAFLGALSPGAVARRARLSALVLEDPRIVDARVQLQRDGQAPVEELTLGEAEVLDVVRGFTFKPPKAEAPSGPMPPTTAKISALLPVRLVGAATAAQATSAIQLAFASHLSTRAPDKPLTLDGLAAAIRDDSRFALERGGASITVEAGDRFLQLTDGVGTYTPPANQTLVKGELDVDVREG
ncbi:hypothetical protein [Sorangium sp. So ce542]|uniref:hypothetical protein n=1 Tax=Sorangium sp. So ce542 TaxID=3133316 RepID=UPI003F5F8B08